MGSFRQDSSGVKGHCACTCGESLLPCSPAPLLPCSPAPLPTPTQLGRPWISNRLVVAPSCSGPEGAGQQEFLEGPQGAQKAAEGTRARGAEGGRAGGLDILHRDAVRAGTPALATLASPPRRHGSGAGGDRAPRPRHPREGRARREQIVALNRFA